MTWRLRLLTASVCLLWAVVAARLLVVQGLQHGEFSQRAHSQQHIIEELPARPGDILDRRGHLLATTLTVQSLFVDPSQITAPEAIAIPLADCLNLDAIELAEHLAANQHRRFLWVKRRLSEAEVERILALEFPDQVCRLRPEFRRVYPHRHIAAHVLGWRNIDGEGQQGVERTFETQLAGTSGQRTLVRDARGYVLEILDRVAQPPSPGRAITLTIDLALQATCESELDQLMRRWQAASASVIVIEPRTGELLAMASRPTFDPNDPGNSPANSWINRAVSEAHEPGSTLKPIIAAWALQVGKVDREDRFHCGLGEFRLGNRILHDTHPYGDLDIAEILVKSSNIGMAQIGQRLGNKQLFDALQTFGFGHRSGVELPAEAEGIVRPLALWDHYSTGSIPMGQEIAATPLQIIRAHAVLANGGRLVTPHVSCARDDSGARPIHNLETSILDEQIASWIREGPLVEVVRSGTAQRAALDDISVFAKTGTAQVYDHQIGAYSTERYVSSCICGAPAEAPRALVLVTVSDAQTEGEPYGGIVAAPSAAAILSRALGLVGEGHIARLPATSR